MRLCISISLTERLLGLPNISLKALKYELLQFKWTKLRENE